MKAETLDEKIMWLNRIKRMILSYKLELDALEKKKDEIFWKHFDAFVGPYPSLTRAKELSDEYDMIMDEIDYITKELEKWKKLYFRDLNNW